MAHPLDGAQLRVERADRHLSEADGLVRAFADSCKQYVFIQRDGDNVGFTLFADFAKLDPMLPVVISDAIHNLRAALDYIVFELAKLDSPSKSPKGTQFIIEDVKSDPADPSIGFDIRRKRYLKLLSGRHVDMIESLQPYMGVEWTKTLRDISNPDKHRELTALTHQGLYTITMGPNASLHSDQPRFTTEDFQIDAHRAIHIAPPDLTKPGIMPTLRRLETEVCATIELFKPEFPV